jgi:hypothetical protein
MKLRWALFPDGLGAFCMKSITETLNERRGAAASRLQAA